MDTPPPSSRSAGENPGILRVLSACLCLDDLYAGIRDVLNKFGTKISTIIK